MPRQQDQQRFFKTRVVAGQVSEIGEVLAVAVDEQGVVAGVGRASSAASMRAFIRGGRDLGLQRGQAKLRQSKPRQVNAAQTLDPSQTSMTRFCSVPMPSMLMRDDIVNLQA